MAEAEAELVEIRLEITTASVASAKKKQIEVTNRNIHPTEIHHFILFGIDKYIFEPHMALVTVTISSETALCKGINGVL